jgi:hypothetical protein
MRCLRDWTSLRIAALSAHARLLPAAMKSSAQRTIYTFFMIGLHFPVRGRGGYFVTTQLGFGNFE